MQIVIDGPIVEKLENYTRNIISFLYGWISTDGEVLGYILGVVHFVVSMTIIVMIVVSHTLYPAFWFQVGVFVCLLVIWLQHIFLKVCISIVAEQKLTNSEPPFFQIIRNIIGISPSEFSTYFVIAETMAVGCFGLEIVSKISVYIHEFYGMNL
jgi:hypothetical protein